MNNQLYAAWLSIGTFAAFIALLIVVARMNKDKEVGKVFLAWMIKYPISVFFVFLGFLNLAEAGLAASASETTNVPVRFFTHLTIGLVSLAAGLVWVKEATNLKRSFWVKPFSFSRVFASFVTFSVASVFTIGLPIVNMLIIANGMRQIRQLELFNSWLFDDKIDYLLKLSEYGLPPTFSPFQSISPAMLATICATFVHIGLVVWEAAKAALITDPSVRDALYDDMQEPKKEDKKKDEKKEEKKEDAPKEEKKEEKTKKQPFQTTAERIISYLGYDAKEVAEKVNKIMTIKSSFTEEQQIKVGEAFSIIRLEIESNEKKFSDKDITEDQYNREKSKIQSKIVNDLAKGPGNGGVGLTGLKIKN